MTPRTQSLSLRQRVAAWLALCAMVWGALVPVLSHAVVRASADGAEWVQVCSTSGLLWVSADADQELAADSSPADGSKSVVHAGCGWCATHASGVGVLPVALQAALAAEPIRWVAPAFLQAAHRQTVWSAAHSRAPPALP